MTKTRCLKAFASSLPVRAYALKRASEFLTKFPWFSFLIQAPQALQSLTGYGVVLGPVMSLVNDLFWIPIRLLQGGSVVVRGQPSEDPFVKAARYLSTPRYHYAQGQVFSYEDHWLLLAGDVVAMGLLMQQYTAENTFSGQDFLASLPVPSFEPWHPETIALLQEAGWRPGDPQVAPLDGVGAGATYLEVSQAISRGFPQWLETIGGEFPRSFSTQWFLLVLFSLGAEVFDWFNGEAGTTAPVFSAQELTIARMFEAGTLPQAGIAADALGLFVERALELAAAAGRDLPGAVELRMAQSEFAGLFAGYLV